MKEITDKKVGISSILLKLETEKKKSVSEIEQKEKQYILTIEKKTELFEKAQEAKKVEFERLLSEAKALKNEFEKGYIKGREWLAEAYSDYIKSKDTEIECSLVIKPNPAWSSADIVSNLKRARAEMAKKLKFLEFQLKSYEEYFPELVEYRIAILDELVDFKNENIEDDENIDPALKFGYLTKEEYNALPNSQKFQKALDRYWERKKSNIEIGRVFERYVGHLYEIDGWTVKYEGIIKGFEDFGRDLICSKNGEVKIIQCKCWSKDKVIREKHIMQLFGTTILYEYENLIKNVKPIFCTTTSLSKEADLVAQRLGVEIKYESLKKYPLIKCNVNHSTNEKIYHLPFDQQYDKIIIGDQTGEFYAESIIQAEEKGFRRAYRWTSNQ